MNPVKVKNLTVAYHKKPVLQEVSFSVPEGKLIGIIGPNGAGKSTLIKAILGLIPTASGEVKSMVNNIKSNENKSVMFLSVDQLIGIFQRMH